MSLGTSFTNPNHPDQIESKKKKEREKGIKTKCLLLAGGPPPHEKCLCPGKPSASSGTHRELTEWIQVLSQKVQAPPAQAMQLPQAAAAVELRKALSSGAMVQLHAAQDGTVVALLHPHTA